MKAVILAGGLGTRISEETSSRPKPMIEIGGRPILWHIMKTYSAHGINEFVLCCGYKGYVIKEYFANYFLHMSDVTFDMPHNKMEVHQRNAEPWRVTLVDTGDNTMTGGRLKRVFDYVKDEKENAALIFLLYAKKIENSLVRSGPEISSKEHCEKFIAANLKKSQLMWINNEGKIQSLQKRKHDDAKLFLRNILKNNLKNSGIPSDLVFSSGFSVDFFSCVV